MARLSPRDRCRLTALIYGPRRGSPRRALGSYGARIRRAGGALGVIGPIGGWGAGFSGGARSLESCGWTGWCELVDNGRRSALSATAGATAGAVSARAAEQQRLQRIVDAVARQEPRISWAAGLRDDGTTTLLVTDLAGGWIPPHVRLPANVTLLEPTARRRDADVIDLLGAVVAVAAHESNTYVAEPGPDAPALTGDRSARSAIPKVDEFGPTLVEAVRRRDSLPRIAQAIALPAVRKTGVLENEAELLHGCITAVKESVLKAYPSHELTAVGDWMLLAAIEALIDEQDYLANYHLAWYAVTTRRGGSRGFAA